MHSHLQSIQSNQTSRGFISSRQQNIMIPDYEREIIEADNGNLKHKLSNTFTIIYIVDC